MFTRRIMKLVVAVLLVAAIAAIWMSPLRDHMNREDIRHFVGQLRGLWYGPAAFIALFALACVFAVPASIFVLAAGLIWGWQLGGTWAMAGGLLGALASFFAGRFIGEGLLERFGRVGKMVRRQVDHAGFKSLLILRFIPGLPFAALNYGSGVAGVRLGDFVLATALGMAPSVYVFAWCADALFNGTMTEGDAAGKMILVCVVMMAIVLLPGLLKRRFRPASQSES
ncbi:MAG TPA: VTT domain-containing protein [Thermoanaerobaculia bacterium]|nr:VTT domain-containing protein [Thermoanaerobaculia bacterium]